MELTLREMLMIYGEIKKVAISEGSVAPGLVYKSETIKEYEALIKKLDTIKIIINADTNI